MTKKKREIAKVPSWVIFLLVLTLLLSLVAIVISFVKLDIPIKELEASFEKASTIIGLIIGVLGVCTTVYFITMGITLNQYKKELDDYQNTFEGIKNSVDYAMKSQLKETISVLSSIESVANENKIYIRLAIGRLMCKSAYSTEEEKKSGIREILTYYTSDKASYSIDNEDVEILRIVSESKDFGQELREYAKHAISAIQERATQKHATVEQVMEKPSSFIEKVKKCMDKMVTKLKELFSRKS